MRGVDRLRRGQDARLLAADDDAARLQRLELFVVVVGMNQSRVSLPDALRPRALDALRDLLSRFLHDGVDGNLRRFRRRRRVRARVRRRDRRRISRRRQHRLGKRRPGGARSRHLLAPRELLLRRAQPRLHLRAAALLRPSRSQAIVNYALGGHRGVSRCGGRERDEMERRDIRGGEAFSQALQVAPPRVVRKYAVLRLETRTRARNAEETRIGYATPGSDRPAGG